MYGFHKVPHLQQGGLLADSPDAESWEFSNENFQRGQPDLLHFIRRKKGSRDSEHAESAQADPERTAEAEEEDEVVAPVNSTSGSAGAARGTASVHATPSRQRASRAPPVNLAKILKEIQVIRDHQMTISTDIKHLQEDNQALWMEAAATQERYKQHQETIDKILRFLATVFKADSRHLELQTGMRRLLPNPGNSKAAGFSHTSDFTDMLDSDLQQAQHGQQEPPHKRIRADSTASRTGRIYEVGSTPPSPAERVAQRRTSKEGTPRQKTPESGSVAPTTARKVANPRATF
ncbi:Heat shock transcription factor, partial [Linderina pennispora]